MTDAIVRTISMGGIPFAVKVSPDGRLLLVGEVSELKGGLEVVDLNDLTITHSFNVDRLPLGIEFFDNEAFVRRRRRMAWRIGVSYTTFPARNFGARAAAQER